MFLLRPLTVRGLSSLSNSDTFRKSAKSGICIWSMFSRNFYIIPCEKKTPYSFCEKLISCKYSNEVGKKTEVFAAENNVKEQDSDMVNEIFEELANGDPQVLRKLKLLHFEVEVLRQSQDSVPNVIKKRDWEYMLTLNSMSARKKYLVFLFKNEKRTENKKEKKRLQKETFDKLKQEGLGTNPLEYSLLNQTLFLRIYNKTLSNSLVLRNELNKEIAQHVVFDFSYQDYMNTFNSRLCAVQLLYCLNLNLYHRYPCFVRLCNLNKDDYLSKILPKYIINVYKEDFPWEVHEESYLNLYPKERLVYLTPHCNESLLNIHPEDVFVIGAFVDKGTGVKASLARAKKHNLRMAKLPLDEFIIWKQGTKSLPLNIVLKMLLDRKFSNDWSVALKVNLPRRHYDTSQCLFEVNEDDLLV